MKKTLVFALVAVLAFSGVAMCFSSDLSTAEDDAPEVAEHDAVTIDGEEHDAFEYLGIIYVVTSDAEGAEGAGVYGVSATSAVDGYYICVNEFTYGEEDEEITYAVTSVLTDFNKSSAVAGKLALSLSIVTYEKDCFKDLSISGIIVSGEVSDEMMADAGLSTTDYTVFDEEAIAPAYTFNVSVGDMNSNVIANYNDGKKSEEIGVYTILVTTIECPFENPGYDIDCYVDPSDNEVAEGAQAAVIGGKLYLDGVEYTGSPDIESQWVHNEDYLADFEIEIKLPFLHICTITGTYEMWMMWATVGIIIILAIVGISMFVYRNVVARRS